MSKESLEHLSCLMDGELSRETGLFMARRLSSDKELTGTWQRYHLIRDCIRQPGGRGTFLDFTDCVKSALAEEELEQTRVRAGRRWLKPAAGVAIAASVALMAIVAIGPDRQITAPASNLADNPVNQPFDSPNPLAAVPISQPASFSPGARSGQAAVNPRLNSYLVRHNQLAGSTGRQGFIAFVPIIATRAQDQAGLDEPEPEAGTETGTESTPESSQRQP